MDMTIHLIKRTKSQRKTFFGIIRIEGKGRNENLRKGDILILD